MKLRKGHKASGDHEEAQAPEQQFLMTADKAAAATFTLAEPRGYYHVQVDRFVEMVVEALKGWEDQADALRAELYNTQSENDRLRYDNQSLRAQIEVFRVEGSPMVDASGNYLTESQVSAAASESAFLASEVARLREELQWAYEERDNLLERLAEAEQALIAAEQTRVEPQWTPETAPTSPVEPAWQDQGSWTPEDPQTPVRDAVETPESLDFSNWDEEVGENLDFGDPYWQTPSADDPRADLHADYQYAETPEPDPVLSPAATFEEFQSEPSPVLEEAPEPIKPVRPGVGLPPPPPGGGSSMRGSKKPVKRRAPGESATAHPMFPAAVPDGASRRGRGGNTITPPAKPLDKPSAPTPPPAHAVGPDHPVFYVPEDAWEMGTTHLEGDEN